MIFNTTGGGAALNFKVLAYATGEALLAATPVENTIGIITETQITSWIFSATEPSPAAAGMVWITTGATSPVQFNALKKNGLQVYPISAKQYVGGAWVDKIAKSYQGGEWVDWIIVLWHASKNYENTNILGSNGFHITVNNTDGGTLSKSSAGMVLNSTRNDNIVGVSHDNIIDFTGLTQIEVTWSGGNASENYQGIGVFLNNAKFKPEEAIAFLHKDNTAFETVTLDVSAIDQNAYIVIAGYNGALTVADIKLK